MGPKRRLEIGFQFGSVYCRLFKFIVDEVSNELYIIPSIPDVGLHLSVHSAKPTSGFPIRHAHWKSHKLGIEEDVDLRFFSPEYWAKLLMTFQESFGRYQPSNDEEITVLQTNFLTEAMRKEVLRRRERRIVDIGRVMQTLCKGTFYRTEEEKLPILIQEMQRKNPSLCRDLSILALARDRVIVPLSPETMIQFNGFTLTEELARVSSDLLFNPLQKAIDRIVRIYPDALPKWFPTSRIEEFFQENRRSFEQSRPEIIDF